MFCEVNGRVADPDLDPHYFICWIRTQVEKLNFNFRKIINICKNFIFSPKKKNLPLKIISPKIRTVPYGKVLKVDNNQCG